MKADERQQAILRRVRADGFVAIEDLAEHFGVTPQTIRRDVTQLCDQGLARRHHGGVGTLELGGNLDFERRRVLGLEAKAMIGRAAAELIPPRAALLLGIGTTPEQVAHALHAHEALTVVTNNLGAAAALCRSQTHTIVLPGGKLRNRHRDLVGEAALNLFRSYRADFAVFGVGGIDDDGSLLDFDPDEVAIRDAMAANARHRILVADHGKFQRRPPVRGGMLADVETLITDLPPPPAVHAALAAAGVRVVVAGESAHAAEAEQQETAGATHA